MIEKTRPDPDLLLNRIAAEESRARRGEVKIFFGSCAGAGKTYAMLEAARARLVEGIDVVAGVVETHGRTETERLLEGIPVLPQRHYDHKGVHIREFDLDAALARKPAILLLDELAHTNAPDSRHPKRWQDMEELCKAGIDVYTTLNVQHLESLSDIVAEATGIWVKETVPDSVFDKADDIELIDLPADDILKRLKEGKIYIAEGAHARAADNFFKKANLITLREIALRRTAERVDAQLGAFHDAEGSRGARVADRILAIIGTDPLSAKVVRSARRMASSLKAPWTAFYVENNGPFGPTERQRGVVQSVLRLAERLGGRTAIVQGTSTADEILAYAGQHGITKIVVGKPRPSVFTPHGGLLERLVRRTQDVDIYVIAGKHDSSKADPFRDWMPELKPTAYGLPLLMLALCTAPGLALRDLVQPIDQALIYLIGNVVVASRGGRWPAITYALASAACFNFFFVPPFYTLQVYNRSYWGTLFVMLVTGMVITSFAARLRQQAVSSRKRENEAQMLYRMTRDLAAARKYEDICSIAAMHIGELAQADAAVWLRGKDGHLERVAGTLRHDDPVKEDSILQWTYRNQDMAGHGTTTMPSSRVLYMPLTATGQTRGVLGLMPKIKDHAFTTEETALFQTFASLLTSALDRTGAAEAAEAAKIEVEGERMRSVLLSSVSHDLRTPLASITGAASSIVDDADKMPRDTIKDLARSIDKESGRLSRLVTNLLDVTSLESGSIILNRQPYFIDEMIGSVLFNLQAVLAGHNVRTDIAPNLPMVSVDALLIEQLLTNLLENAAKYTDPDSHIDIEAALSDHGVMVTIADNGPGIPVGKEKLIFDKFYTLGNRVAGKGTGLGLAICQAIVRAHGGQITAAGRKDGGASFSFTLPVAIYAEPEADE